jgi:DNA polymerase I-like protein with 3'-5' exonuclease and polymerase domains
VGGGVIISSDLEWNKDGFIDVLGVSWQDGAFATACDRNEVTFEQYLELLRKAEIVVGQNFISADCRMLAKAGVDVSWLEPKVRDIRLMMHAVHGHLAGSGSYDLRSIVLLAGERQGKRFPLDFKKYESDLHATCAMDSAAAGWVYPTLDRAVRQYGLEKTVDIAHRCAPIFAMMEARGVRLDRRVLEQIHVARKQKVVDIVERYQLWEERGKKKSKRVPIWRSNKILDIFHQQFGVRPASRQRKVWEKLVTDESLSPEAREFASAILDLGKAANDATFVGKAEEREDGSVDFGKVGADGFIHPRYDQCGSPDRAVSSGPNIQQWPRPSDDPRPVKLRSAVIPVQDDHLILGVDLGSVETYTNAIAMGDWDRVKAIQEKRVSHEGTAELINKAFGLSLNRNQGKACNHAFDKGESPFNLAVRLFKVERPSRQQSEQCKNIFALMLKEYPKTSAFRDELWERAKSNPLVVTNAFGRRLSCFSRSKYGDSGERFSRHDPSRKYWCPCGECAPRRDRWKYAVAFLGRSAAFDALLRIMAKIWYEKRLDEYSLPYMEVHDELDFSVPADRAEYYAAKALEAFQEPVPELGNISLPADAKIGKNWAEAH